MRIEDMNHMERTAAKHIEAAIEAGMKATGGEVSAAHVCAIVDAATRHILDAHIACRAIANRTATKEAV